MSFLAFLFAAIVLAITPGPGMAYVVARTVAGGRSEGLASCFGTALGGLLHVVAAALGLSLIVAQSALAFNVIKYLGAVYLVYLGIGLLLRRDRGFTVEPVASPGCAPRAVRRHHRRSVEREDRALLPGVSSAVRLARRALGTATGAARKHLRRTQYAGGCARRVRSRSVARVRRRPCCARPVAHPSLRLDDARPRRLPGAVAAPGLTGCTMYRCSDLVMIGLSVPPGAIET